VREFVAKTSEMLGSRVDQVWALEDKIANLSEDLKKEHAMHDEYKIKIVKDMQQTDERIVEVRADLAQHMETY